MSEILLMGLLISAGIGLLHAAYVFRAEMAVAESGQGVLSTGCALYYALWTLLLWLLLGSYALLFWLVSVVLYALYRAAKFIRPSSRGGAAAGHPHGT